MQKKLGDDRFYKEFLFFYAEKKIHSFTLDLYVRLLKLLGSKRYTSDFIFWNNYVFPKIYTDPLNYKEAHQIWEALIALKLKCPELNCDVPIKYIESLMAKLTSIDGYSSMSPEIQSQLKETGDLPDGVQKTISVHHTKKSKSAFI